MKNFISIDNLELKSSNSIKSFISASSGIKDCLIKNVLHEDKNIWLSEDFLPQEITLNFKNIKLKEYPKKLTAIGIYCWNKYPTNPKIIEVLISKEQGINFISLGHFDLSFKAGRQLIYLDDENDIELEEILSSVDFNDLIIKLIIKETFGGKHTYINNLYLYDKIDTNNINISNNNMNNNSNNNINENNNIVNNDNTENIENKENNNIKNNDYMLINENDVYEDDMNINEINHKEVENKNNSNKFVNQDNMQPNGNENLVQDIMENAQNISNQNLIEENENHNVNFENDEYNKKLMNPKNVRKINTPKLRNEFQNMEDRPMTSKSLTSRNNNTTGRNYNSRNILNIEKHYNNSINNNIHYNEMSSSDKLNFLLNEFKNLREHQEYIMNNYESRVRLLEEKCFELKNNLKKMNATMNTIIESQYSQNQASNDYLIRECHNMVNEAIVNILSNMGRNFNTYNPPMYRNQNMLINRNRNFNNNNFFNNFGNNMNNWKNINNNNYIQRENYKNRERYFDDINNDIYNEDNISNKNFVDENENGNDSDKINSNNNHEEEYLEKEFSNNKEDEFYNNNDINKENENNDDYFDDNNNDTMKANISANSKHPEINMEKGLKPNELYKNEIIYSEEKMKTITKKKINNFANSTNNYKTNNNTIVNSNQNNNLYNNTLENDNSGNAILMKSRSNTNIKSKNKNKKLNQKKKINNTFQIFTEKRNVKKKMNPEFFNNINDNDLSSDNSLDDIVINTKITENILKPTLEKFESYMNVNNFGKSQNVYSMNSFSKKKEIFGEKKTENKMTQSKGSKDK